MDFNTLDQETVQKKQKFHQILYVQVIFAIILGILIGHFYPELGESLKPLGDAFIKIVKMIIAPVIFLTVVTGIASMTGTVAKLAMRQPFVLFKGLTFQKLCLP
ncbi:cation:dicarboxylase symporter family transporter, partial [Acinetobacter baumannii]|nr:cation:dicarboxylase symporter family transporter [Acinetobacter baumannii]